MQTLDLKELTAQIPEDDSRLKKGKIRARDWKWQSAYQDYLSMHKSPSAANNTDKLSQ